MTKDYVLRELPYMRGSRRRTLGRFELLHQAFALAEAISREGRLVQIELHGLTLATLLNGSQLPPSERAAPAAGVR